MRPLDRVRGVVAGEQVDHLPAQPMLMMFAARHAGIAYVDYTRDGMKLAESQLKVVRDFGVDCVLMCSDPAREVIDIAGDDSVRWLEDQGPVILEERAALLDKSRLSEFKVPDPHRDGRMCDRVRSIEICWRELGGDTSIVGWVEGPLALSQELRGLNRIMTDIVDDPTFVRDLMDFASEVAIVYASAQIDAGADTIGMSDAAAKTLRRPCPAVATTRPAIDPLGSPHSPSSPAHVRKRCPSHPSNGDLAGRHLRTGLPYEPGGGESRSRPRSCHPGKCLDGHRHAERDARKRRGSRQKMPRDLRCISHRGCRMRGFPAESAGESPGHDPLCVRARARVVRSCNASTGT